MTTPILEVKAGDDTHLLRGSGARYYAKASGSVTLRPIDTNEVTICVPDRTGSLTLCAGDSLTINVATGYLVVEID